MSSLDAGLIDEIYQKLLRGDDIEEYRYVLYPPERQEAELVYAGKLPKPAINDLSMAVPLQLQRTFGTDDGGWLNRLIFGNNIQALRELLKTREQLVNADGEPGVRLIYIDPPFGTGDEYGPQNGEMAYSARLRGAEFLEFLRQRLYILWQLLTSDGSMYVRIDYHFGHYLKVILDEVCGPENFQNEIIINRFKRQLRGLNKFNVAFDSLFYYTKGSKAVFNEQKRKRLCTFCGQEREPSWGQMSSPGLRNPPERTIMKQPLLPPKGRHWTFIQERIDEMEEKGRIRIDENLTYIDLEGRRIKGQPEYLQTEDVPVDSNWSDLRGYVMSATYPTENHEELLERVIRTSSNERDIVLDAFAGSGTTLAVSEKLNRRWIGIDSGKLSIYTIQKRMLNLHKKIGNEGGRLVAKPFALYNAGLYDERQIPQLPWAGWKFFALKLFECREAPHPVNGVDVDGYRGNDEVLVFDYKKGGGVMLTKSSVKSIAVELGSMAGRRFFIIAPSMYVGFHEDYLDIDNTRYYILRVPYNMIAELHKRTFSPIYQPIDGQQVNSIIDSFGFDFTISPDVECEYRLIAPPTSMLCEAEIRITKFVSKARVNKKIQQKQGLDALSMVLIDFNYPTAPDNTKNPPPFELDKVFFGSDIKKQGGVILFDLTSVGESLMIIYIDIYGNEHTEVKSVADFVFVPSNYGSELAS